MDREVSDLKQKWNIFMKSFLSDEKLEIKEDQDLKSNISDLFYDIKTVTKDFKENNIDALFKAAENNKLI